MEGKRKVENKEGDITSADVNTLTPLRLHLHQDAHDFGSLRGIRCSAAAMLLSLGRVSENTARACYARSVV